MTYRPTLPIVVALLAVVAGCQASAPVADSPDAALAPPSQDEASTQTSVASIPDSEIGLSKASVFEAPVPEATTENQADPGELPLIARAYPGAPPLVPHNVADMLPITRSDNLCLDCHAISAEDAEPGDPTPIPVSHTTDIRGGGEVRAEAVGARWVCVSCHVAPGDAGPLVGSTFPAASAGADE